MFPGAATQKKDKTCISSSKEELNTAATSSQIDGYPTFGKDGFTHSAQRDSSNEDFTCEFNQKLAMFQDMVSTRRCHPQNKPRTSMETRRSINFMQVDQNKADSLHPEQTVLADQIVRKILDSGQQIPNAGTDSVGSYSRYIQRFTSQKIVNRQMLANPCAVSPY